MKRQFLVALLLLVGALVGAPAWAQISNPGMFPTGAITPNDFVIYKNSGGLSTLDAGIGTLSGRIVNLANPSGAQDAATKAYVDANAGSLIVHSATRVASTANLNATYANGASGVGATLTNAGTLAALVIDGVTIANGDRILYKDATTQFQNGVYTQTTTGTGAIAWVLTRATDFDQVSSTEVGVGALFNVSSGTVNASTAWLESGQGPFTIGTTAIVFSQFGQQGAVNCSQLPALTGDATTSVGGCATTVGKVDAVTYPAGPAANTVPVVTSATSGGTVTYEAVPNAALANSSITVNSVPCTLGSTCTITAGLSGLTNNVITKATSGSTIGSSSITDSGTTISTTEPVSTGGIGVTTGDTTQSIPNNATATVLHKLAILASGTYQATAALTTSTTNTIGICDGGCSNTGSATIAWGGIAQCVFDGATTAGDWVVASTTVAADCHDSGATVPTTVQVLGQVTSTNGAGGTFNVDMNPVGITSAINTKIVLGGTSGQIQYNNAGAFGGFTASGDWTINTSTGVDVVAKVNSVTYPAAPSVNTVPVVTSASAGGTVTYEAVPNAALANSSVTVNTVPCTLGSTCTIAASLSGLTNNVLTKGTSATTIGSSSITDNGTTISTSETISAGGIGVNTGDTTQSIPNNSVATVLHKLAILASGTYQATAALTSSTANVIGICDAGCTTTGSATIAWAGIAQCVFDGATTAGHWVVASTTVAADCHDAGATVPTTVQVLGQVTSTNGAGGTFSIDMNPVGASSAINANIVPRGTSGQIQYNNSGVFGGFTPSGDWTINTATGVDVVAKVNSVTYPAGPAVDTVPVVTSAASGGTTTYKAVPSCTDTVGNHLNYTAGSGFSCGTSNASGMTLISTQNVSAQSDIHFTGLTNAYNTVFLSCEGLTGSSSGSFRAHIGEGAGPTWETGANYIISDIFAGTSDVTPTAAVVTNATDLTDAGSGSSATTVPSSLRLYLGKPGATGAFKVATFHYAIAQGGAQWYTADASAYWSADTNPVTGLQVIPESGTITGTCSLYGMS